jgi:NADPH:quinone reductase-like Zn-dependent oxidoreductase
LKHQSSLIPCSDAAGTIVSAGPGSIWAGQDGARVGVRGNTWTTLDIRDFKMEETLGAGETHGSLAKYVVLPDSMLVSIPEGISLVEAACYPAAGATSSNALLYGPKEARPGPGKTVLTLGTGGVSCFAIQVCGVGER